MTREDSTLPGWIPARARFVYSDTGPYPDARREQAMFDLFHADGLEDLFRYLGGLGLSGDVWSYLIRCIVNAVECVPEGGAANRDRPDDKILIRDRQAKADALLFQIAAASRGLAGLLDELDGLSATVPDETYSSLALIDSALSRNAAKRDFEHFRRDLSSYQRYGFPRPADLLHVLAAAADSHLPASRIFEDDPWLRSQRSSWRDFVRIVADDLNDIYDMHQLKIELREKHWISLVHALISPDIGRSSVNAERRRLPPFPWQMSKK